MIKILKELPQRFLTAEPENLCEIFDQPCVIDLKGKIDKPLLVTVMLHGNEPSGLYALQKLLPKYIGDENKLPRSIVILVGNVLAAREGKRLLEGQQDFNRIWNLKGKSAEHQFAKDFMKYAKGRGIFAAIDVHNNTGANPLYGCINKIDNQFINLAKEFCETIVYFTEPDSVFSLNMKDICPSITIECGKAGDIRGLDNVVSFLDKTLNQKAISKAKPRPSEYGVYHTIAQIKVPDEANIAFGEHIMGADINFIENIDHLNFIELKEDTCIGYLHNKRAKLIVTDFREGKKKKDISDQLITYDGKEIHVNKCLTPSMFTKDVLVMKQDCLGYFMERIC